MRFTYSLALSVLLFAAPATAAPADATLTLTAQVLLPGGDPAPRAEVAVYDQYAQKVAEAQADEAGRFQLRHGFFVDTRLHLRSADDKFQTTRRIYAAVARRDLADPIELKLLPARELTVTVAADGQPLSGAQVAALGWSTNFVSRGVTDAHGAVHILVPPTERLTQLVAFSPDGGVGVVGHWDGDLKKPAYTIALHKPASHTVRVVDAMGHPVADLNFAISVGVGDDDDSEWINLAPFAAAHLRTNADGEAAAAWVPAENLRNIDAHLSGHEWKLDSIDRKRTGEGVTTLTVRRQRPVAGQLTMPDGADPTGVLVMGRGFGPGNHSAMPSARAASDGSFTLPVASDHGFALGVADHQWTSDLWTGNILPSDDATPAKLKLTAYRGTPVVVRVTRGPDRQPFSDAWIEYSHDADFSWNDAQGEKRNGQTGVSTWLRTDSQGEAHAVAARGKNKVRIGVTDWNEEREFEVRDDAPVAIEFHRPWLADRQVAVQLTNDGEPYRPSAAARVTAFAPVGDYGPKVKRPPISADGKFTVAFDAEKIGVLVIDSEKQLAGYGEADAQQDSLEISMAATASYDGVAVDNEGQPVADLKVKISVKSSKVEPVEPFTTGLDGRFRFDALPAGVPFWLSAERELNGAPDGSRYEDRLFKPGEDRADARLTFKFWSDSDDQTGPAPVVPPAPLPERLAELIRDVRLAGMRALVIASGDAAADTMAAAHEIPNYTNHPDVLAYRVLAVPVEELKRATELFAEHDWRPPAAAEIALYVVDGEGATVAHKILAVQDRDATVKEASAFIADSKPPQRDAQALLTAARDDAQRTGRRVWLVESGPRCGPCFRLARWMDDHHELLDKDYVIAKIMGGLDRDAGKVIDEIPHPGAGIPWHAITDPDGKVLVTSDGPNGNIGCPAGDVGIGHLREMIEKTAQRLTAEEIDQLTQSLAREN